MKVLFLGTGAADWPQNEKSDYFRRNSAVLIDECILIDPGVNVPDAIVEYNVDVKKIKYVLNTHRHSDHFNEDTLKFLTDNGAAFKDVSGACEFELDGYSVQAVAGHHPVPTVHYIISDGKSSLFYGLDSAWLLYDEVEAIKKTKIDYAVFDGTIGFIDGDYRIFEHNNMNMVIEMKKTLLPYIKRFCISHMAYTLHDSHEKLASDMKKYDIEVAFDGMVAEF